MPVFLDVEARLNRASVDAAAREIRTAFNALGRDVSGGLGSAISRALAFDTGAARRESLALQQELRRAADVEADAARRMVNDLGRVEFAQRRLNEVAAKYGADSSRAAAANVALADSHARAAKSQRDHVDAMVGAEGAHRKLGSAAADSAASVSTASRVFNGVGIASVVGFGAALIGTTKSAADFQQSQQRLVSSAGESAQNLKAVSDGILKLSGQVGYSSQDLMNNMYTVEKAGYRGAGGVKVLGAAAQLAKAENADLGEVLNGLTTSMHDFGYGQDQAALVASKMNTAVGEAKTTLQEFSGALHSVEPIAAAAGLKLEDVYGSLAQITQSGTSADQGAQNMAHSISQLMKPTQQMRDEMGQLGIDARDVQAHLGDRGYAGTVQYLSNTIKQHMDPAGQVVIDTMFKSQQAADAANQIFNNLPPAAKAVAQSIKDGTLSYKDFRKTRGGLDVEQANEINQWNNLNNKVTGYSAALKSGQGDIQTYEQALAILTGGQDSLRTVLQLVGVNADATNDKIQQIKDTTTAANGTVKGFNETSGTLNQKMDQAKSAFNAAAIEVGSTFIPVMTDVANIAKTVGDELAKHPGIARDLTMALGAMGGAWLVIKGYNIVSSILGPIASGLVTVVDKLGLTASAAGTTNTALAAAGTSAATGAAGVDAAAAAEIAAEERVTAAAGAADAAMGGGGAAGAAGRVGIGAAATTAAGTVIIPTAGGNAIANDIQGTNHPWYWAPTQGFETIIHPSRLWDSSSIPKNAAGGPLHAPGPKGVDSALFWGADGEHVLTASDVDAMGGHGAVHAFRNALHREYGGAIGPDVQAAMSMGGMKYSQGDRTDCSGMVGRVINTAMGIPGSGLPTTQNMGSWLAARGFVDGLGPAGTISVGWYNHGSGPNDGHTAMTLSDGENAESGGSHGNFIVGAGAAGAANAEFDHHMYLPELFGEGAATGGMGAGGFGGAFGGGGGFGGGGIPGGAGVGIGPGGMGYYTAADPQKVASAQEQLRHLDAEIATAEERRSELKGDAKQSEKDRLDEEIRHLKAERVQEEQRLQKAEQGTFHAGRGRGGAGLPVALADRFGLGKGLPGLAEWVVGYLEDLVLGPAETAVMAGLGAGMGMAPGPAMGIPPGPLTDSAFGGAGLNVGGSGGGGDTGGAPAADDAGDATGAPASPPSWFNDPWFGSGTPAPAGTPRQTVPPTPPTPPRPRLDMPPPDTAAPWVANLDPRNRPPGTDAYWLPSIAPRDYNPGFPQEQDQMPPGGAAGPFKLPPGMAGVNPGAVRTPEHHATGGPVPRTSHLIPNPGNDDGGLGDSADMGGNGRWNPFPRGVPGSTGVISGERPPGHAGAWHFATGGPSGTDTIPSWLSPGEFVEPKSAVDRYGPGLMDALRLGRIDASSIRYLAPGGPVDEPAPPKPAPPAPPKPTGPGGAPKPQPGINVHAGLGRAPGPANTHQGLQKPGAAKETFGQELPASGGIGFGGGALGAAEGAASQAAGMAAGMGTFGAAGGAASSATQLAFQVLNRTAAYGAQAAGIGVEGLMETFLPADSPLSNFANTLPGKLLAGVAGVRPAEPNTAGRTAAPLTSNQTQTSQTPGVGGGLGGGDIHIHGVTVQPTNFPDFINQIGDQADRARYSSAAAGRPMRTP